MGAAKTNIPATIPPPTILPAVANPVVIPTADNPTVPEPYNVIKEINPPIPAPNAPVNTSGIALSLIVLAESFNASAASFITFTTCCNDSTF